MPAMFDHEKLDVYQLELKFIAWAAPFIARMTEQKVVSVRDIIDHLNRASTSALFNTAEGNGKRQRQIRAKFFDDARASAAECAASLDAFVARRACTVEDILDGKAMLVRVYQMLTRLVQRYDANERVGEEETEYGFGSAGEAEGPQAGESRIEDEDDDEDEDD